MTLIRFLLATAWAALSTASVCALAQQGDELATTRRIIAAGANRLALDRIVRLQPQASTAPGWADWEGLHCTALGALHRDAELAQRVAALPLDASADGLAVCFAAGARASLALQRFPEARRMAARAIWQFKLAPADLLAMRRVAIDAYAGERRGDEAYRAMLRFQQDMNPLPRDIAAAFVTALLELRLDREALTWLPQLDDAQPAKLALRMRVGLVPREAAVAQARAVLAKGGDRGYWYVILDAAGDASDPALRVSALEQLLDADPGAAKPAALRLWAAYGAAAIDAANRAKLLVGDDANWADYAGRRLGSDASVARAFFAYLAQHGQGAMTRHNAQLQLLYSYQTDHLEPVALRVFEAVFGDVDALDTQVRYRLGAMAEARAQPVAARYWRDLPPPPDMDAGEWLLRNARLRWRAGDQDTGMDAITRYYAAQKQMASATVQQGLAYADELVDGGRHAEARRLLEALVPRTAPAQSRAATMALARAYEADGDLKRAAEAYLGYASSASGADADAVRARLRAGVNLARSGYVEDARAQFEWIVKNVKDAAQVGAARSELARIAR